MDQFRRECLTVCEIHERIEEREPRLREQRRLLRQVVGKLVQRRVLDPFWLEAFG